MNILGHPLRRLGHIILEAVSLHQLSPVSDHFKGADEMLMTENVAGSVYAQEEARMDDYWQGMMPKSDGSMGEPHVPFS